MPVKKTLPEKVKSSDFKKYIESKFKGKQPVKPKRKKVAPYLTEGVVQMRLHIGEFCRKYPRTGLVFNKKNHWYKIGWKYFGAEDLLQIAFCNFLKEYHPTIEVMHPKNEGKEGRVGQAKKILMYVRKGASDILLQKKGLPDFWLELKAGKNTPTEDQKEFLEVQAAMGKHTGVGNDLFQLADMVRDWLAMKK